MSGNAVNWLECVAKGHQVTLKPIGRDKEDLVSTVLLHIPQAKVCSAIYVILLSDLYNVFVDYIYSVIDMDIFLTLYSKLYE